MAELPKENPEAGSAVFFPAAVAGGPPTEKAVMTGTGLGKFVAGYLLLLAPALLLAATAAPGAPGADRRPAARASSASSQPLPPP